MFVQKTLKNTKNHKNHKSRIRPQNLQKTIELVESYNSHQKSAREAFVVSSLRRFTVLLELRSAGRPEGWGGGTRLAELGEPGWGQAWGNWAGGRPGGTGLGVRQSAVFL